MEGSTAVGKRVEEGLEPPGWVGDRPEARGVMKQLPPGGDSDPVALLIWRVGFRVVLGAAWMCVGGFGVP